MRGFVILCAVLLCAGCTSVTDVSHHARVRDFVGRTVDLRRPMLLVGRGGYLTAGDNSVACRRPVHYGLTDIGVYPDARAYARLPSGHAITVDTVEEETCFDAYQCVVYGHTIFPPSGKVVRFACLIAPLLSPLAHPDSETYAWEN